MRRSTLPLLRVQPSRGLAFPWTLSKCQFCGCGNLRQQVAVQSVPPQRRCHSSPVNGAQDPGCTLIEGPNGGLGGAFSLGERGEKQTITSCRNWPCVTDLTYILSRSLASFSLLLYDPQSSVRKHLSRPKTTARFSLLLLVF